MKTKKSVKSVRSKVVMIVGLLLVGSLALGVTKVWGQVTGLPRLTTACETKVGGVLLGIDDGFSTLKNCPGNSRKVTLGEAVTTGGGTGTGAPASFYNASSGALLKADGTAWNYQQVDVDIYKWVAVPAKNLPNGIVTGDVVSWDLSSFMTKSGDVYLYSYDSHSWLNIGKP